MIDIEQDVYDLVSAAVLEVSPGAFVVSKETRTPSKFPCISIVEADNRVLERTQDSGSRERHVSLMYEINVYSNKQNGGKSECKAILEVIDDTLMNKGFTRTMKRPISMDDATKYRLIARYTAIADENKVIYRR